MLHFAWRFIQSSWLDLWLLPTSNKDGGTTFFFDLISTKLLSRDRFELTLYFVLLLNCHLASPILAVFGGVKSIVQANGQ
jgi:hypothetical protein